MCAGPDDAAGGKPLASLMVARLPVQIARLEAEEPSDPRIVQVGRGFTGVARDTD